MPGGGLEPDTRLLNNPYGYNGEDYDIESNLQYLRARYYDPEIGRFISEDSYLGEIMQPLTLNRYAYTANNPLMYQDPSGHSVVKFGSRGQSVKELQQLLISSGYNGLKVDGVFGKGTLAAVKAYQTSKGLTVDGIVGSQTWEALRGSSNPTLRKGSRGGAVTKLQQGLLRLGYDLGPYGADGVFGDKTKRAVKDFQGKNGLTQDGIVGKQTWAALAAKKVISNNGNDCGGSNNKKGIPKMTLALGSVTVNTAQLGTSAKVGNFSGLNNPTIDEILGRIPSYAKNIGFQPEPGRIENGFKFRWTDSEGVNWEVWGHEADPHAPEGSNSSQGWTYRVTKRGSTGRASYWNSHTQDWEKDNKNGRANKMNETHNKMQDPTKTNSNNDDDNNPPNGGTGGGGENNNIPIMPPIPEFPIMPITLPEFPIFEPIFVF